MPVGCMSACWWKQNNGCFNLVFSGHWLFVKWMILKKKIESWVPFLPKFGPLRLWNSDMTNWRIVRRRSLCCCFSFLMENQGQRELKMIRHVYGVLVIHEVFQRIVWHTILTLQHHSSGSDFWVSSSILAGTNVWPVTLELSKGKKDLHFQTMDKYCDDLLWLESLIDGWGQTLTLITEKNHIIARITDQILITSFLQPNVALMVFCTPSNNICCALFRLTFFLDWSQDCKSWWYIRSGNTVKGIQAQQGWRKMIKFCVVQSSAKTLIKCVLIFSLGGAYGV